ncbi:MAG: T9SS type A sorting domain-containing protein [bacterium]
MAILKPLIILLALLLWQSCFAQLSYTGAYGGYPHCEACHASGSPDMDQFTEWHLTSHAAAYDDHPELQNDDACLPCHTTGWDVALNNGGFDDFFYAGDTTGMNSMRNVQCESCHGPTAYPHTSSPIIDHGAELCGQCHNQEFSAYYDEWAASAHHGDPAEHELECAKCHEAASAAHFLDTGEALASLPDEQIWEITCAVCHTSHDPELNDYQLRLWPAERTCRSCHTADGATVGEVPHSPQAEMLIGPGAAYEWPGYWYNNSCHEMYLPEPCVMCHQWPEMYANPDTVSTGHALQPDILFCAGNGCHAGQIPPDSSFNIAGIFEEMDSLIVTLDSLLQLADTTRIEYWQAKYDYDFVVNDGSRGVHNYFYARDLLISSIEGIIPWLVVEGRDYGMTTPDTYVLHPAHPNPFNPVTWIAYELPVAGQVRLDVYDIAGRNVRTLVDGWKGVGSHVVEFTAVGLASGVYIYHLEAGNYSDVRKMVLMR